ncbi:MAG: hypothetical protein ACPKNR_13250 [Pleomorphochaeta sp.]
MTYTEIEKILTESKKEDWLNFRSLGKDEITYKKDLDLVIKKDLEKIEEPIKRFNWDFDDDVGQYPCWYDVYYKNSLVAIVKMLEVNNRRVTLPFGMNNFRQVTEMDVNLANIIDLSDKFWGCIRAIGYEIIKATT